MIKLDDEEKKKRYERALQLTRSTYNDSSSNFNNIALNNLKGNTDEEKEYINRFNRARELTNSINPRENVPAPTLTQEQKENSAKFRDELLNDLNRNNDNSKIKQENNPTVNESNEQKEDMQSDNQENKNPTLLDKAKYIGKRGLSGIAGGTVGIGQAGLTDAASNMQKGKEKSLVSNITDTIQSFANPTNFAIKNTLKNYSKEVLNTILDKDKTPIQKFVALATGAVSEGTNSIIPQKNTLLQLTGKVVPNVDQATLNLNEQISKPIQNWKNKLYDESQNYGGVTNTLGNVSEAVGNMIPSIAATVTTGNGSIGLATMGISAKGQSTMEALDKGVELNEAVKIGDTKGMIEVGTEMLYGGINIFGKGFLDKFIQEGIIDKVSNNVAKFFVKQGFDIAGEIIEEHISDGLGTLIDKGTVDPNATYTFKDWSKTALETTLTTFALNLLTGGLINDIKGIKKDNNSNHTNYDVSDIKSYFALEKDVDGNITNAKYVNGIDVENPNKKLNINPAIVKNNELDVYNVIDSETGIILDSTPYESIISAKAEFNHNILNLSEQQINDINRNVEETKMNLYERLNEYMQETQNITSQETQNDSIELNNIESQEIYSEENKIAQNGFSEELNRTETEQTKNSEFYHDNTKYRIDNLDNAMSFYDDNKTYNINDVENIYNDRIENSDDDIVIRTNNDENYITISQKDNNTIAVEEYFDAMPLSEKVNSLEIKTDENGNVTGKQINDAIKELTIIPNENVPINGQIDIEGNQVIASTSTNENKSSKRVFQKEIEEYKKISKQKNISKGSITEININILDGISKKKQSSFINEYLKNEVKGHDYYVDNEKIIATGITIGKLKNGKTKFDNKIEKSSRYEIKANVISNIENIIKNSTIYQANLPDTKNHTFADTFDRRKSIFSYKGQKYEVMFETGKKNDINTLYSIENIKKTNKNRLSLPNLTFNNKGLNDTKNSVGSHKSKDSISQKGKTVKSTSQKSNIKDFGEKIGGARKDTALPRGTKSTSKEVIHDYTIKDTDNGYSVDFKGKTLQDGFKTQKEAEEYILAFKDTVKSNLAFVEKSNISNEYIIKIRNPRTLKTTYTNKKFSNLQDAESYAIALSMYLKEHGKNLFRPQIQKVERVNTNNKNATKTTGDNILNDFGFKGGEFGNWVTQNERQQFLNYAQDAFTDLATALEVIPSDLGQNGDMNIAFGARGKGLSAAVAHFEPVKKVINMTRLKGAGSLAHEYGHSIDNWLSRIAGYNKDGMVTEDALSRGRLSENLRKAVNEVTDAMNYNISTNQEEVDKKNAIYEKNRIKSLEYNLKYIDKVFNGEATKYKRVKGKYESVTIEVTQKQKNDYQKIRNTLINGEVQGDIDYKPSGQTLKTEKTYPEPINKLQQMYKEVVGRKLDDDTVYSIYRQGKPARQITEVKSESAYIKSARELDEMTGRKSPYYSRIDEMWARAFESYISDKLKAKGITDTYLVHSVNNSDYALFNPFPAGEERQNINKAFDNLIQVMKDEGILHENKTNTSNKTDDGIRYMKRNTKKSLSPSNNTTNVALNNTSETNGASASDNIILQNMEKGQSIQKELHKRIQNAIISKNSRGRTYLGNVSSETAKQIKNETGIDVKNRRHVLADNEIRHMIKQHGNPEIEKTKGQIAITTKDIEKIPDIINNYDNIVKGTDNSKGQTIRYIKEYSDNKSYVVEVVPEDGNALKIKTMWKKPVGVTNNQKIPSSTSKTKPNLGNSTSNKIIPQNFKNVKKQDIKIDKDNIDKPYKTNQERADAWIEQEIKKVEETGNWDNTIPATSLTDIRNTIEDYLGLGVKRGKFRQSAYGIYKTNRGVIRAKEYSDIDTILHETGHALDLGNRIDIDKESIADELINAIDRLGGYEDESRTIKLEEGFAEVIREYSIIPETAKKEFPKSVAIIEGIRQNDKSFDKFISKVQQQTYNYIHQNPQNRVHSKQSIGEQTDKPQMSKAWIEQEVKRAIWDKDIAVKNAVEEIAKVSGKTTNQIKASNNAYYLTRLTTGMGDKVTSMLADGYINNNGEKIMPGLNKVGEILGDDPQRYNDLRDYLVAKRDTDYKAKTLKTGIRDMDTKYVLDKFKNDAQIQEAAQVIYDTLDGVMQYAVENGLISEDDVKSIKESNAFYVPMQRVIEGRGNQVGRKGAVKDIIKTRTGSELDIKDVLENIVTNSSNIIQQVENNNVLKALYNQGEEAGLTGAIYDVIDTPMMKVGTANLSMWENELKKQGVDTTELDLEKTVDLFAPDNKVDTKNLITSFINEDGKRVYLQFNDGTLFNSLMNLDGKMMSNVLKINSKLNMPLRYGATMANIGFAIPNMISDTAQATVYSNAGFIPVIDNALGILDVLTATNNHVKNFVKNYSPEYVNRIETMHSIYEQTGATNSTRLSQFRDSTQSNMKDIYGTKNSEVLGIHEKYKPLKRLLDILTYIPEISEQSTRFRVFEKNYDMYKEKGNNEMDSRILAALESRDATQDFGRTGNLTREINQLIPFSAARVGSSYTFAEKIKANPKQTAMRIAVLSAIAMAIKAIGYDDKEIEELNQRKKDDNFVFKAGDNVVTIKKPQGILRSIINLTEYIQDLATGHIEDGKEGERLGQWINNTIMDNLPADNPGGYVPNLAAPIIENWANKDFYYNTDIVKSYDLDLPDSEQYYDYNSQLAILLGKAFNYSPAKIDNLISGYFAGLGTQVTNIMDYTSGKIGLSAQKPEMGVESNAVGKRFIVNVNSNSASIDEVYNRKTELTKKKNGGTITSEEETELSNITNAVTNMSKVNKQIKEIKKDLTMSGKEKAEKIKELQKQRTDIARQALGKELLNSESAEQIETTSFYPTNSYLSLNNNRLELTSDMKQEYSKLASEFYKKYENQGIYSEEKLKEIKTKAKDYAKKTLMQKYRSQVVKSK